MAYAKSVPKLRKNIETSVTFLVKITFHLNINKKMTPNNPLITKIPCNSPFSYHFMIIIL